MKYVYSPKDIESIVQKFWSKKKIFDIKNVTLKKKYYCLSMFPYPSGKLHIGHIRNYTIGDIISRYKRLNNYYVLNPIGWDSFGMPAENAAYYHKILPKEWVNKNIKCMKKQLKRLGFSFAWDRELVTSNSNYYKWEQLLFIKLYNSGLVYKKKTFVNWDPIDKTVLANEQVINGRGWRSRAKIERKKISQWYLKITKYSNRLLNDLAKLSGWPEKVKNMQKNWIKKKNGYEVIFNLHNSKYKIKIFLEKLELLHKILFITISDEHDFVDKIKEDKNFNINKIIKIKNPISKVNILTYIKNNTREKRICEVNFLNTDSHKLIKKNIKIPISKLSNIFNNVNKKYLNLFFFRFLKKKNTIKIKKEFSLKDWCISRQRYWGAPIPIIYCDKCGIITEKIERLPVVLPDIRNKYENISLLNVKDFVATICPLCNSKAKRELDTFDTFFESSWYYIKYISHKSSIKSNDLNFWLPVDQYIGGIEHATLHLIYARFFHKLFNDFNIVKSEEPFVNLLTQGMVLKSGTKMSKSKGNIIDQELLIKQYGADALRLFITFVAPPKQSFEWNENGIQGCKKFLNKIWKITHKFKNINIHNRINCKILNFENKHLKIINSFNDILEKIILIFEKNHSFNVVVALLMTLLNLLNKLDLNEKIFQIIAKKILESLLIILSPISPHITHFLWSNILNKKTLIINENFPSKIENKKNKNDTFKLIIQINSKFKLIANINKTKKKDEIIKIVTQYDCIKKILFEKTIKNIIYKKFKIINIILN